MLPVPLNSWKISSSMRLPVSIRAVPTIVSEPPSSKSRAVANSFLGMSIALMSTPPLIVRPVLPTHLLNARASRVIESISRKTSLPISASRLQRSTTSWREPHVAFDVAVEAAGDDLAVDGAAHVGDFFGPLVDQQHDQLDVGVVRGDRLADVLQQDRLAGSRRGDDQGPLALAQRRQQVHHPGGQRLGPGFQLQPVFGVDRRQLVEGLDVAVVFGRHAVDVDDFLEPRPLLLAARLDHAVDEHALAQAELVDHAAGHERIGHLAEVVGVRIAEEAVAVGVHFQHAAAGLDRARLAVVGRVDVTGVVVGLFGR